MPSGRCDHGSSSNLSPATVQSVNGVLASVIRLDCATVLLSTKMNETLLIKGATIVTLDSANAVFNGDLLIENRRISRLAPSIPNSSATVIEATGRVLIPGFVQTHIHLCQTLFRGAADDLALIDWLKTRIWPLEAAHTGTSVRASARLGIAELVKSGTTCALTMETVNHTDEVFKVVAETGFRATVGKCMM